MCIRYQLYKSAKRFFLSNQLFRKIIYQEYLLWQKTYAKITKISRGQQSSYNYLIFIPIYLCIDLKSSKKCIKNFLLSVNRKRVNFVPMLFSQMTRHDGFKHFLAYSFSYALFGANLTCLGPMFPYLAAVENRLETQYSFLFVCRAVGFISGSLLLRFLGKHIYLHQIIILGISLTGFFSLLFHLSDNLHVKGFFILILSIGSSFQDITLNIAAVERFKGQNMAIWLQLIHGSLGIGGLIGPLVVYWFELKTLLVFGCILLATLPFYFLLETPQKIVDVNKMELQDSKVVELPKFSIYIICACFLLTVGQETAFGGWISSYAVLQKFSEKQHATFYSSIYWIAMTAFRFIMTTIQGTASNKLKALSLLGAASMLVSYFAIFYVNSQFGLISMSILLGLGNSVLFPLLLTIPEQFGYHLSINQTSLFLIWASLGDGCLGVVVGKLMEWFTYNWLIFSITFMNLGLIFLVYLNEKMMKQLKATFKTPLMKDTELQQVHHFYLHKQDSSADSRQKIRK